MMQPKKPQVEQFPEADLAGLREELLKAGLDSWQAAELISGFLAAHGYGVSTEEARVAVSHMESIGCSLKCLQAELEKLAHIM
ncbi:hypothetical protein GCM10011507_22020 [Edaphobacter acidisoli]|uniref:Uncharacterized protein n=1 Tax=Edaphobacter acidisoli TaxID=2040573 RepID=A0A916RUG6_9BACT|nr:hypothetical protein [Edaphobacter acidisoli]GGA70027.1 hypothetical protein GCM10011507_22020 [Edaphobacter acidisoli]